MSTRKLRDADASSMSDAEWDAACDLLQRKVYAYCTLKPVTMRIAEAQRRRDLEVPPTLLEAITSYLSKTQSHRRTDAALSGSKLEEAQPTAMQQLASVVASLSPCERALSEAHAMTPQERVNKYGGLVGIPFELREKLPSHFLDSEMRFELPHWSLAARYDQLRLEYFVQLIDASMDKRRADKILANRRYDDKAKRAHHADEAHLTAPQKATLRRLRLRVTHATDTKANYVRLNATTEQLATADRYIAGALAAVQQARVRFGLAEEITV